MKNHSQLVAQASCFELFIVFHMEPEGVIHFLARIPAEHAVALLDHPDIPVTKAMFIYSMMEVYIENRSKILREDVRTTNFCLQRILSRADSLKVRSRNCAITDIAEDILKYQNYLNALN